jgi:hypothetical protein
VIFTGATSTELLICSAELEIKNEAERDSTELMPLHALTPQVRSFGHIMKATVFNKHFCDIISAIGRQKF